MILFGLPTPSPDDASNAARCCVQLAANTREWLGSLPAHIASRIGFKIGANFGIVVASRLGRDANQQIAATGDTVNVASRLMEIAADRGATVAVTDALLNASGREPFAAGALFGPIETTIRGRTNSVSAWLWQDISRERLASSSQTSLQRPSSNILSPVVLFTKAKHLARLAV